jgi:hypothetical protein
MSNVRRHMRIHMHPIASWLLVGLFSTAYANEPAASAPEALFSLSVEVEHAADGKALNMTVRETTRTPDFSLVEVRVVSGESTTSLLYLARGLCGVMQARGQKLAVGEQISEHPVQYRLSFPKTARIEDTKGLPRMVLSEPDCARLQQRSTQ